MEQEPKRFDIETFGEIMDKFIHENKVGLMVLKEENSDDWQVTGMSMGAVIDFYVFLNALAPIYTAMLDQMRGQMDGVMLAESLTDLMKKELIAAAAEKGA